MEPDGGNEEVSFAEDAAAAKRSRPAELSRRHGRQVSCWEEKWLLGHVLHVMDYRYHSRLDHILKTQTVGLLTSSLTD